MYGFVGKAIYPAKCSNLLLYALLSLCRKAGRVMIGNLRRRLRVEIIGVMILQRMILQGKVFLLYSLAICIISCRIILYTVQLCRRAANTGSSTEIFQLFNSLFKAYTIRCTIKKIANRWILGWHRSLVYALLQAFDQTSNHILLRDHASFHCDLRPFRSSPYFYHTTFVYANIVTLYGKAAHHSCKLVKTIQGLIIQMQHIWKWYVAKIAQSNGNFLEVE